MNQHAKVGLIVLGLFALGIFLADERPHKQFDPRFILFFVIVIGVLWFAASWKR
jgi:hypothetical protein